ncbi:MAG: PEP-CTERM sorting domain-containing protein, partial [Nitrospinales bacterium]
YASKYLGNCHPNYVGFNSGDTAVGSGSLNYDLAGNVLTVRVDNTSPLTDSGGNSNSPAIVGFGFDTSNIVSFGALNVKALGFVSGTGSGGITDISSFWQVSKDSNLQGGGGGLTFDFVPNTTNGVQGGLINPNADGFTGRNLFETQAIFEITFVGLAGDLSNWHMRFRNLGLDGEGSLNNVPGAPVPEPATVLLLGVGLAGLFGFRRKKFLKK